MAQLLAMYLCVLDVSADGSKSTKYIRRLNPETKATLDALSRDYKESSSGRVSTMSYMCIYLTCVTLL